MKYRFLAMLSVVLLTGCSSGFMREFETVPVTTNEAIMVSECSSLSEEAAEYSLPSSLEQTQGIIYSSESVTERYTLPIDSIKPLGMHLTSEDTNYLMEAAYLSGDTSYLDEKQKKTLLIAARIVNNCNGMGEYDKVVAIHDQLAAYVQFGYSDEQYSAYGALVLRNAVCQGYAEAFKLCMDLAGIDCITVGGEADNNGVKENHAWNMIRIGQNWYHVDLTWDDPKTEKDLGAWNHLYLFVGDSFISANHSWNTIVEGLHGVSEMPTATDEEEMFLKDGRWMMSQEQFQSAFLAERESGVRNMEYVCEGFTPSLEFVSGYSSCTYLLQEVGKVTHIYLTIT